MKNKSLTIKSKLSNIQTSVFSKMTKMAIEYNALNLSQGFPDINPPDELLKLVSHYQNKGFNQYAPMTGVKELRENICKKISTLYHHNYNPETEITITSGATQAIYTAITTLINKNDEVIIFEPAYDSYVPSVIACGGKPVFVPLTFPHFKIDWELFEKSITKKTKLVIINSPHNPTGYVISNEDLKKLEDILQDKKIIIISDEVYEHIVFDGKQHISISQSEQLSKKAFVISSFGKTYHTTGWKAGYCTAPEFMMNEFRKFHQFIVFSVNTPVQYAYADILKDDSYYKDLSSFYQQKRDFFIEKISDSKFKFKPAEGTYFQLLDYSNISEMNDIDFTEYLTKEIGIASIPLSPFYNSAAYKSKIIRICFAKNEKTLNEAANKLKLIKEVL